MSSVRPRLAALCMFGGLDSPSPNDLSNAFLKHRENVTSFLMQSHLMLDDRNLSDRTRGSADDRWPDELCAENVRSAPPDELFVQQRPASMQMQLAAEHHPRSVHLTHGRAAEGGHGSHGAASSARGAPLQLSAATRSGRPETYSARVDSARVDIWPGHRCGDHTSACETECAVVHEVEQQAAGHGASEASLTSRQNMLSSKSAADSSASTPLATSTPNSVPTSSQTGPRDGALGVDEDDRVLEANRRAARLQIELNAALTEKSAMANELKVALGSESLLRSKVLEESSRIAALERTRKCMAPQSSAGAEYSWEAVWGIDRLILELKRITDRDDGCALVALVNRTGCSYDELHPQLHGHSLLHYACERDKVHCCRELLKAKADPNNLSMPDTRDEAHVCQAPLHVAVKMASQRCIEALLADSRVHVDAADSEGRTPLHVAAALSDEKAIESLLASNGDPLIKDKYGKTSLQYAREKMQSEAEETIRDHRAHDEAHMPQAHNGSARGGQAGAADARSGRKPGGGVKKKSGYIHCKKCGNHHHWHSKCSKASKKHGAGGATACSLYRRPSSSDTFDRRHPDHEQPRDVSESWAYSNFMAAKLVFRKKRKQKPLNQRHTKPRSQGKKPDQFDADPYRSAEDADDFADLGSDDHDRYGRSDVGDADGRICGVKRPHSWALSGELSARDSMRRGQQDDQGMSHASVRRVAQLAEFKARHGHTWVSTNQHSKFYVKGLGGWVVAQRKARRRGEIGEQLGEALEDLGFSWEGPPRGSLRNESLHPYATEGHAGGGQGYESELEGDAECENGDGDWHADEDGLDEPEEGEPGGGLWGCSTDANGNHDNSYDKSASPLEEDPDMNHLNQIHLSSIQHQSAMALVSPLFLLLASRPFSGTRLMYLALRWL